MSGHFTGPNSQDDLRSATAERIASERSAMTAHRSNPQPGSQHSHLRITPAKFLGRRIHTHVQARAAGPRNQAPPPPEKPVSNLPDADRAPPEIKRPPESASAASKNRQVLHVLNRAGRLTFDAMLLIVFAPVIAVWWLNERRHKR